MHVTIRDIHFSRMNYFPVRVHTDIIRRDVLDLTPKKAKTGETVRQRHITAINTNIPVFKPFVSIPFSFLFICFYFLAENNC